MLDVPITRWPGPNAKGFSSLRCAKTTQKIDSFEKTLFMKMKKKNTEH